MKPLPAARWEEWEEWEECGFKWRVALRRNRDPKTVDTEVNPPEADKTILHSSVQNVQNVQKVKNVNGEW